MMMFMIGGFNPEMPWHAHKVAELYSKKLAKLGSLLSIGSGALFFVPLTQGMAFALASLLLISAIYFGSEYRKHVDEVVKQTPMLKLIKIFAPTWRYFAMTTILLGVGLGLIEWSFFGEQKHLLISLIVSGGILDVIKGYFASK
ncbi:MAG TPA: hypothetical protein VFW59_00260 [Gallionella sp.]|nr:hypothetical protein [Gallionella sp.]